MTYSFKLYSLHDVFMERDMTVSVLREALHEMGLLKVLQFSTYLELIERFQVASLPVDANATIFLDVTPLRASA